MKHLLFALKCPGINMNNKKSRGEWFARIDMHSYYSNIPTYILVWKFICHIMVFVYVHNSFNAELFALSCNSESFPFVILGKILESSRK